MIKQLLNSIIAKYRDLPVSCRSIICLSLWLRQVILGTLRKTRRQRQRERQQTKASLNRTMAMHVRFTSLPSSAKQEREMTKLSVVRRT